MNQAIWNNKEIPSQGKSLYQPLFHKCEIIKVGDLISNDRTFLKSEKVPGGYSWEFLMGVCRPVLQILTQFQTKNVIFRIRFQTWPLGRNYVIIT